MGDVEVGGTAELRVPAYGPKDGSMTIGDGVDGRPYISDPIKERIAMPGSSYNPGPEHIDAVRREIRAELDKTQARIEREAKYAVGTEKIAAERRRQVEKEGWTPEHDAEHTDGALIKAAVTYAREALWAVQHPDIEFDPTLALTIQTHQGFPASTWPWDAKWWKPNADPVLNLVKAGALIAAEIDRLLAARRTDLLPAPEFTDGT